MENYEKKLNSLNESDAFKSLMTPEEDYKKILNTERYLGEKEGIEKGQKQGIELTAIKLLNRGMSLKEVCEITDISIERLNELVKS